MTEPLPALPELPSPSAGAAGDVAARLEAHRRQIDRLVCRLVDPADRDDARQELVLAALQRPPRQWAALPAWISATLRHLVAKGLRGRERRARRELAAARDERLPSSAELAARLDLEQQLLRAVRALPDGEREAVQLRWFEGRSTPEIARALCIGESTVRARLQRAIATLRAQLDARDDGGRRGWVALLAPWALPVAPVAAGGGAIAIAVAATLLVAGSVTWRRWENEREGEALREAPASANANAGDADGANATPEAPAAVVATRTPAGDAAESIEWGVAPPAVGLLHLFVVDGATQAPVAKANLRALSPDRFVDLGVEGHTTWPLTATTWEVRVTAAGFEPFARTGVVVARDLTTDLGTIALRRGTARVAGRLRRHGDCAGAPAWIELRGDGRAPCPRCDPANGPPPPPAASPLGPGVPPASPCCGYFPDASYVAVDADGRFRFERLAAGHYFARPLDATLRLQPTVAFEVDEAGTATLDLDLHPSLAIELELFDEWGAPFVGRWATEFEATPAPLVIDLEYESTAIAIEAGCDAGAIARRHGRPPRLGQADLPPESEEFGSTAIGVGYALRALEWDRLGLLGQQPADRAREPGDLLDPVPPMPPLGGCEWTVARLAPNRFRVGRLAPGRHRFQLRCLDAACEPFEIDLSPSERRVVRVVLAIPEEPR